MAFGLWLVMAIVVALALWHLRQDALEGGGRELRLLALASRDGIERGLRGAEDGLHAVRAELEEGRLRLDDGEATRSLQTRAALMPLVEALWVLRADGQVIAGSDDSRPPDAARFHPPLGSLARADVSLGRVDAPSGAGPPDVGRIVAMAIAVDASLQGARWIVAAMPSRALLGTFGTALPAADARLVVLRRDGAGLVSVDATDAPPQGRAEAGDDLVSVQHVPRYGLELTVSKALDAVMGTWREAAQLAAAALAILLLVMALAVALVQRADRRRAEAQAALQAQLARASKLESLGTLAGGVAHDFNNVLAGIVGYGEMAQDSAAPGSAQARHLERVMQAASRGKALVERILAFSRGGGRMTTVFELEPVVDEVLELLSASLPPGIVLERRLAAPGARLKGDATQVFEAAMNLCTNAMQAMPGGGVLGVRLARVSIAETRILSHTRLAAGDYVALTVEDQGVGISPEVMEHLFEPFFTTRAAQSGTGLGLAVVFGVVTEFGGAIDVRSSPGQGARFTLYLPPCADDASGSGSAPVRAESGAGQRVLVVDDEPALVAMTVESLAGLGYAPVGFTDATAALKALQEAPDAFAAVVTDEVMPGLTGTQLTQALRQVAPRVPVLLVSGFGGALLAQRASGAGVTRVLAKPLRRDALACALAEVLREV